MAFRVLSYLRYFFFSRGLQWLHSPFVFAFASKILKNQESKTGKKIEAFRLFLGDFQRSIKRKDLGAGSTKGIQTWSKIADLARVASRRRKAGELLYRIVKQYQPKTILEFGTHLGISGLYLQSGNPSAEFITMEGDPALAALAKKHFKAFGYKPEIITGDFSESLRLLLIDPTFWPDLVFVDGNHRKKPTLNYFDLLLPRMKSGAILVFDDIHWSKEMEEAWNEIKENPEVTVSIDVYQFGICFMKREQAKEDFVLKW